MAAGIWERWLWLGAAFLLAVAAAQAIWRLERAKALPEWAARVLAWPYLSVVFFILRLIFYVGVPFAALIWGRDAIVGSRFGLQPLFAPGDGFGFIDPPADIAEVSANWADWMRDLGWAVGLGVAAWSVLAVGWWAARGKARGRSDADGSGASWSLFLEAVFHEVHWAFYRNAPIVALELSQGAPVGVYWGAWLGLGLVTLEAVLNPAWWESLRDPHKAPAALIRAGMAVLSTALFLQTQNLWLAIVTHWAVTWGMRKVQEGRS